MDVTSILSTGSMLFIALIVFVVMSLVGLRKGKQAIFQVGTIIKFLAAAPFLAVLYPLSLIYRKVPGLQCAGQWCLHKFTDEAIEGVFDRLFRNSRDPLLRGDLEAYAHRRWPRAKFPLLWESMPEDLQPALVRDGRLVDNSRPATLAPMFVDRVLVGDAFRSGILAGAFWLVAGLLLWNPQSYFGTDLRAESIEAEQGPGAYDGTLKVQGDNTQADYANDHADLSLVTSDVWSKAELQATAGAAGDLQAEVVKNRYASVISGAPNGMATAILFAFLAFFGTWRGLIRSAVDAKVAPLLVQTKAEGPRFKKRADQRQLADATTVRQMKTLTEFDKSPTVVLGKATGILQARGGLQSPTPDQPMAVSVNDLTQHVCVMGGTGEGKTRSILLPLTNALMAIRANDKSAYSFYCTDAKGVLWRDIRDAAVASGQLDDVRVIGCDEKAGEYGVDLLDGVAPQLVADIIRSVARQTGGAGGKDSFWPDMASEVIRNCATICRAWEATHDGYSHAVASGARVYSLVTIYQLSLDPALQERAFRAITEAYQDPDQYKALLPFMTPDLEYASDYMGKQWKTMADATKSGILANITQMLSPFATNLDMRRSFASGMSDRLITIGEAWGAICLVNVPALEYGVAGRIVNVFLKTLLYTEARNRQRKDPKGAFAQKMVFLADEFQDLITVDEAGVSDSTFWNVARSTGTMGVICTQGVASLEQVVGQQATENFLQQLRTKVILRIEDTPTISYIQKMSGQALRSEVYLSGQFESYETMVLELGYDPLKQGPARISHQHKGSLRTVALGWTQAAYASLPVNFKSFESAFSVDERFIPRESLLGHGADGNSILAARQAAAWRAEDKNLANLSEGNREEDIFRVEDMHLMGRGHCWLLVQRAGGPRLDIARIG